MRSIARHHSAAQFDWVCLPPEHEWLVNTTRRFDTDPPAGPIPRRPSFDVGQQIPQAFGGAIAISLQTSIGAVMTSSPCSSSIDPGIEGTSYSPVLRCENGRKSAGYGMNITHIDLVAVDMLRGDVLEFHQAFRPFPGVKVSTFKFGLDAAIAVPVQI
jgi:hypothetical protein